MAQGYLQPNVTRFQPITVNEKIAAGERPAIWDLVDRRKKM